MRGHTQATLGKTGIFVAARLALALGTLAVHAQDSGGDPAGNREILKTIKLYIGKSDVPSDAKNYEDELTDYSDDGKGHRRCPKYMFIGNKTPIFIEGRGEAGMRQVNIKVTSQTDSAGVRMALFETGASTGIYRNVTSYAHGSSTNIVCLKAQGEVSRGLRIAIKDEELLTVTVIGVMSDPDQTNQLSTSVMVDRAECGVAGYSYTKSSPQQRVLANNLKNITDLVSMLIADGWESIYRASDDAANAWCLVEDFEITTDAGKADAADLVYWSGHGGVKKCGFLRSDTAKTVAFLTYDNAGLGDTDANWAIFDSCDFFTANLADFKKLCGHGLRLACGYASPSPMDDEGKAAFFMARLREGKTIKDAWCLTVKEYPPKMDSPVVIGVVVGVKALDCGNDSIVSVTKNCSLSPIKISRAPSGNDGFNIICQQAVVPPYSY